MFSAYVSLKKSETHPEHNFIHTGENFDDVFDEMIDRKINADYFFENLMTTEMRSIQDCECRFFVSLDSFFCVFQHNPDEAEKVNDFLASLKAVYDNESSPHILSKADFISALRKAEENFNGENDRKFCEALAGIHAHNRVKDEEL